SWRGAPAMMLVSHAHAARPTRRAGFTLVEVLVVLAILSILFTLAASATMQVVSSQRKNNTELTVSKVATALHQQWMAVIDQAKKEQIPEPFYSTTLLPVAGNDDQRARVIWIKLRLKQEFPMTFAEAVNPVPLPPKQVF